MSAQARSSVCPLDCPDTCSLTATVAGDRLVKVTGSHANPLTRGSICAKVYHYPALVHGPDRLRTPLKRVGARGEGKFEPITWERALDLVHDGFTRVIDAHGPQAILPFNYAGPHGVLAGGSMDLRFFNRLGASRLARRPLCGGVKGEAFAGTFGAVPLMRPDDVHHARLIVVWGLNVTVSQLHLMPEIRASLRAGGKLVVVDPRRTPVARKAHVHVAIRPGTDVVLALALAAELERIGGLDRDFIDAHVQGAEDYLTLARGYDVAAAARICGVSEAQIRDLASLYAASSPAVICPGNGPERNRNGGSGLRAVFALPALAGKFGVPGGGLLQGASAAFPSTAARLEASELSPPGTRTINIVRVGRHLLEDDIDPPIRGLFIYNHNPVVVHPEQNVMKRALARDELFIVACDVVMTDSVRYADVVLPACTHFEHDELFKAYGQHYLQRAKAVIPPVGEALPNTEIFRRLARRFGFTGPAFEASDAELMDQALDADDPRLAGRRPSELPEGEALLMTFAGEPAVFMKNTFPKTPSGRIELHSGYLAERYGQALPRYTPLESEYPLWLISPGSEWRTSSTFGGLAHSDEATLEMHPVDAAARGLADGDRVRVWNELGEVYLRLRITEEVRAGVACSLKGLWLRTAGNGQTVSALAPGHLADLSEGACYNDARVEVSAA
ncbi:MAG: molybdopterin-dependent oxidoreductase [Gammaproteobacteria bacterium]|nr:molybdopterin-dependent oxidoreductase [Gammaproteobacteria bacterium]